MKRCRKPVLGGVNKGNRLRSTQIVINSPFCLIVQSSFFQIKSQCGYKSFTILMGFSPLMYLARFSPTLNRHLWADSAVAPAIWGVRITFFSPIRGLLALIGWVEHVYSSASKPPLPYGNCKRVCVDDLSTRDVDEYSVFLHP